MRLKEWHPNRLWYIDAKHELFGFRSIHKMIIVRLATGGLVVHNPIAFSSQLQQVLEELGSVKAIICASPVYHSFLSEWWLAYPNALFFATPTVIQKRTDLHFDGALSSYSPEIWRGDLYQTAITGFNAPRKFVFCDPASRTLILSDHLLAVQKHMPAGQKLLTLAQGIHHELKLPYSDKRRLNQMVSLRSSIQEIMTWPFERLISTNGLEIENEAKNRFFQAFWWAF